MENKKRLIDANAVDCENIMCSQSQLYWINAIIEKQPTVDAVEVVRCKDCIYSTKQDEDLYCDGPIGIFGTVGFSDFCSCGERKKDGDL